MPATGQKYNHANVRQLSSRSERVREAGEGCLAAQRKSRSWKHASQHSRCNISRFRKTYARRCRREPALSPLPPLHIPVRLFCETGAYRQKLRRRAKGWVVARDQIRGERAKRKEKQIGADRLLFPKKHKIRSSPHGQPLTVGQIPETVLCVSH